MRARRPQALAAVVAVMLGAAAVEAVAEEPLYRIDFASISVADLVEVVSGMTGQNVILEMGVEATRTVTVIAPRPLPADAALEVLSAALAAAGLRLEERGEYWVIGTY